MVMAFLQVVTETNTKHFYLFTKNKLVTFRGVAIETTQNSLIIYKNKTS